MYYNTTNLKGTELFNRRDKAGTQEQIIFEIFKKQRKPLTASDVWGMFGTLTNTPLTSIRRAITNLMGQGKIEKTKFKRVGIYGAPEHFYKMRGSKTANKKQ